VLAAPPLHSTVTSCARSGTVIHQPFGATLIGAACDITPFAKKSSQRSSVRLAFTKSVALTRTPVAVWRGAAAASFVSVVAAVSVCTPAENRQTRTLSPTSIPVRTCKQLVFSAWNEAQLRYAIQNTHEVIAPTDGTIHHPRPSLTAQHAVELRQHLWQIKGSHSMLGQNVGHSVEPTSCRMSCCAKDMCPNSIGLK
jgi:hypothetical protein